jgi:uncharacterized protein (TIGR02452 family)
MKRQHNAAIAEDTLRIIQEGGYDSPKGERVELRESIERAKAGTRLYDDSVRAREVQSVSSSTAIQVTSESTCAAIVRMEHVGGGHLAALNFASARNPGGGFLGGAQAQEEALARSSALYPCLLTQPVYYERNRAHRSALYLDFAIFSPGVPFFKDDSGKLLQRPACCSIITAPAPNAGAVQQNQPADISEIAPTLQRRVDLVLSVAAAESVQRLILGAWGCGVFRNDPSLVAATFGGALRPGGRFAGVFAEVVFAVYDSTPEQRVLRAFNAELSR